MVRGVPDALYGYGDSVWLWVGSGPINVIVYSPQWVSRVRSYMYVFKNYEAKVWEDMIYPTYEQCAAANRIKWMK